MAYNIAILPKAQEEIQKAFEYYEQISVSILKKDKKHKENIKSLLKKLKK